MARKSNWNDDYWLYVMQLYMRRPTGVKPLYAKAAVDLSLELHIHPKEILARQMDIETLSTPRIERIWDEYGDNPRKLSRAVRLLRSMKGFGSADEFYEGVETVESFERDFRPVNDSGLQPIALVLILDLYFRLTPLTMGQRLLRSFILPASSTSQPPPWFMCSPSISISIRSYRASRYHLTTHCFLIARKCGTPMVTLSQNSSAN